jgi:hypothetical protein
MTFSKPKEVGIVSRRKDPGQRARSNGENRPFRVVGLPVEPAPELPERFQQVIGDRSVNIKYPEQTRTWWEHWIDSPLNDGFTAHDWDYLLITAAVHARVVLGIDHRAAAELRLREAKFGVTPEDRAKLRLVTVNADNAEELAREAAERNSKVAIVGEGRRLTAI